MRTIAIKATAKQFVLKAPDIQIHIAGTGATTPVGLWLQLDVRRGSRQCTASIIEM